MYQGDPCLSECYAVRVGIGRLTAVLFSLAVGAKHVDDFVLVELLHVVAGRTEVLAGVELSGLLGENLAHSGGHGETAVGVDVDLANGALGSLAELFFGDTDGIGELAAIFVDGVDILLRYRAGAMEHDGESGELLHNGIENLESQRRGNKTALGVAGALLGGELVGAVAGADRDGERVAAGAGGEVDHFLGIGVGVVVRRYLVFNAGENAELAFYGHIILMSVVDNLLCEGNIFLVGEV